MKVFSKRLIDLRNEKNISQRDLSKDCNISQSAIAKWELGKSTPNGEYIVILAKYFGVSSDYLLGLED